MENLELQEKVKNLGKLFVKELGLEPGVDTFSRWMAHYIAEKMTVAEQALSDEDKKVAEKECFETILVLWKHRWSLPSSKRPFGDFEFILKTLKRLNPNEQEPFFIHSLDHELSQFEKDNPNLREMTEYSKMALQIDKVARIWIDYILKQAAIGVNNEKVEFFIENSVNIHDDDDIEILQMILDKPSIISFKNSNDDNGQKIHLAKKIKERIEELKKFSTLNDFLIEKYQKDIEDLEIEGTSS